MKLNRIWCAMFGVVFGGAIAHISFILLLMVGVIPVTNFIPFQLATFGSSFGIMIYVLLEVVVKKQEEKKNV